MLFFFPRCFCFCFIVVVVLFFLFLFSYFFLIFVFLVFMCWAHAILRSFTSDLLSAQGCAASPRYAFITMLNIHNEIRSLKLKINILSSIIFNDFFSKKLGFEERNSPTLGASGAVSGIVFAHSMTFPTQMTYIRGMYARVCWRVHVFMRAHACVHACICWSVRGCVRTGTSAWVRG